MKKVNDTIKEARKCERYRIHKIIVAILTGIVIDFGSTIWV